MKSRIALAIGIVAMLATSGCALNTYQYRRPVRQAPAPCIPPTPGIHYQSLVIAVPVSFGYTPKDQSGASINTKQITLDELNQDGKVDGNSFSLQNGSQLNFTFTFTIYNNNETYTGGVQLAGWGQGNIHYFSTSGSYNDPVKMIQDLTDQAYTFLHGGWHDNRTSCPQ